MSRENRKNKSKVWNFFTKSPDVKNIARCNFCKKDFVTNHGTTTMKCHIKTAHGVELSLVPDNDNTQPTAIPPSLFPKSSKASGNQEHKVFRKAQKRPARDSDVEDDEDLMDDIVGMLTSGNLPIETVENKSFQRILQKAGGKKRSSNFKISNVREAIREGVESGTVSLDAPLIQQEELIIKTEAEDTKLTNQVWLDHDKFDDEYESESNSSYEAPSRPSTSKRAKLDSNGIDVALTTMLIASSVSFELIDNIHFKRFIEKLNPDYNLPRSRELREKVIKNISKLSKI